MVSFLQYLFDGYHLALLTTSSFFGDRKPANLPTTPLRVVDSGRMSAKSGSVQMLHSQVRLRRWLTLTLFARTERGFMCRGGVWKRQRTLKAYKITDTELNESMLKRFRKACRNRTNPVNKDYQ